MPETIPTKNDPLAPLLRQIPIGIDFLQPEQILLRVGEAAEWLRRGAPGRALEALETILAERESTGG